VIRLQQGKNGIVTIWQTRHIRDHLSTVNKDRMATGNVDIKFSDQVQDVFHQVRSKQQKSLGARKPQIDLSSIKHSKDSMKTLNSRSHYVCNRIKAFDFSTLYTTIPHKQIKSRNKDLIQRCFSKMYPYLFSVRDKSYFVKSHSIFKNKYKQD